jgi:hypothetical protein
MKAAFISLCAPKWQQEYLKTGTHKSSLTWSLILSKVEALEMAEIALADLLPAKETDNKQDCEEGEVPSPRLPPKKAKQSFFFKMHGPDQRHNTSECKVITGEIERLEGVRKPPFNKNKDSQQGVKPSWIKTKKCTATSYLTEQLF